MTLPTMTIQSTANKKKGRRLGALCAFTVHGGDETGKYPKQGSPDFSLGKRLSFDALRTHL